MKFLEKFSNNNKPKAKIETVSIEEHNKVKQALETITTENAALKQSNAQLAKEEDSLRKEFESLKAQNRFQIVAAYHEGCYFKNDEAKKASIESFTKSKMDFLEIATFLNQLRSLSKSGSIELKQETKLPQRSTEQKKMRNDQDFIY